MNTYGSGQLRKPARFLGPIVPKWLVLGGPSCADEAMTARSLWPNIQVISFEPSREFYQWQLNNGFPKNGKLFQMALGEYPMDVLFYPVPTSSASGGTLLKQEESLTPYAVPQTTLDTMEELHGPFHDAFVWLDIEGSEVAALRGATNLIKSGRPLMFNIEICLEHPTDEQSIREILGGKYHVVDEWNRNSGRHKDQVWMRN